MSKTTITVHPDTDKQSITTSTIDMRDVLDKYTQSREFERSVNDILARHKYDLFTRLLGSHEFSSGVTEATRKVTDKAERAVDNKLNGWKKNTLPGVVAREIQNSLLVYFENNAQVQNELSRHIQFVRSTLETQCSTILYRILSDPQYHTLIDGMLKKTERRCAEQMVHNNEVFSREMTGWNIRCDATIADCKTKADTTVDAITRDYDTRISHLTTQLNELESVKSRLGRLELGVTILGVVFVGYVAWSLTTRRSEIGWN